MIIFQLIQKPQFRGAELFACQLSGHLEKLGHQVIVISLFEGRSKLPFTGEKIQLNRSFSWRLIDYKGWFLLSKLIQKYQPDIIQCNAGDTLKYAVISKKIFGWKQPIVFRNASMVSLYVTNPIVKFINGWLYRNTDTIISVSENSKRDLIVLFPENQQKTTVVPVGIESFQIKDVKWKSDKMATFNIIHVGGFSFEKNHKGLLSIFQKVLETHPNVHLHLLGEGPLKSSIQQLVASMNLEDKVIFYGWVSNPIDYIANADVLVLPSIIEGLPGVILEAMSVKTVVVAYDVGGISEIIEHNSTGFLVPKNDELNFVNYINIALKEDLSKIIKNASIFVNEKYRNNRIARIFEKKYLSIINKNSIQN